MPRREHEVEENLEVGSAAEPPFRRAMGESDSLNDVKGGCEVCRKRLQLNDFFAGV